MIYTELTGRTVAVCMINRTTSEKLSLSSTAQSITLWHLYCAEEIQLSTLMATFIAGFCDDGKQLVLIRFTGNRLNVVRGSARLSDRRISIDESMSLTAIVSSRLVSSMRSARKRRPLSADTEKSMVFSHYSGNA